VALMASVWRLRTSRRAALAALAALGLGVAPPVAAAAPAAHVAVRPAAPSGAATVSKDLFGHVAVAPAALPSLTLPAGTAVLPVVAVKTTYGIKFHMQPLPATVRLRAGGLAAPAYAAYGTRLGNGPALYVVGAARGRASSLVGADGSFTVSVRAGSTHLSVGSVSACYGCALSQAAPFFPALARAYRKTYGRTADSLSLLGAHIAHRRIGTSLIVYAFRDRDGQLVEGFVAAPMSLTQGDGLVYSAQWVGPAAQAPAAASELAVALRTLSD
jgi:hypothetical protein